MVRFILKRLGLALITLWILSVIVFVAGQVLPGDPARAILGPLAAPSAVGALRPPARLDRPLLTQYWSWISQFPGTSYQYQPDRADADRRARPLAEAGGRSRS